MKKTILIASAVVGLSMAAGASAFAFTDAKPEGQKAERSCFFASQINGWRSDRKNDKVAYLEVGTNDMYRADLFGHCNDLDDALAIGVETRGAGTSVCDGMDVVLIVRSPIGPQRCPVTKLTKMTPEEIAALKAERKKK